MIFRELHSEEKLFTQEDSACLENILSGFLKSGETVLICYPEKWGNGGELFSHAVRKCHGIPVVWGEDGLWNTLLRQAFFFHCTAAIGDPLILLGLSKIRNATGTPLYIRNAVLSEAIHMDWLSDDPLDTLWQDLSGWNSVLDCLVSREAGGLNLELVVFPGLRLPNLPSCARLTVRNWNPEEDHPFLMKKTLKSYAL